MSTGTSCSSCAGFGIESSQIRGKKCDENNWKKHQVRNNTSIYIFFCGSDTRSIFLLLKLWRLIFTRFSKFFLLRKTGEVIKCFFFYSLTIGSIFFIFEYQIIFIVSRVFDTNRRIWFLCESDTTFCSLNHLVIGFYSSAEIIIIIESDYFFDSFLEEKIHLRIFVESIDIFWFFISNLSLEIGIYFRIFIGDEYIIFIEQEKSFIILNF